MKHSNRKGKRSGSIIQADGEKELEGSWRELSALNSREKNGESHGGGGEHLVKFGQGRFSVRTGTDAETFIGALRGN